MKVVEVQAEEEVPAKEEVLVNGEVSVKAEVLANVGVPVGEEVQVEGEVLVVGGVQVGAEAEPDQEISFILKTGKRAVRQKEGDVQKIAVSLGPEIGIPNQKIVEAGHETTRDLRKKGEVIVEVEGVKVKAGGAHR